MAKVAPADTATEETDAMDPTVAPEPSESVPWRTVVAPV